MNYLYHYKTLIRKALRDKRVKLKKSHKNYVYYERHHIIPKSLGGLDVEYNTVLLTAKEHFVSHLLLVKICEKRYGKLHHFTHKMIVASNRQKKNCTNAYQYQINRIKLSEYMSLNNPMKNPEYRKRMGDAKRGKSFKIKNPNPNGPWNKGKKLKPLTESTKLKMSEVRRGIKKSDSHKLAIRLANKGKIKSKEHINKLSLASMNKRAMNNGIVCKLFHLDDIPKMILEGWRMGRVK